MLKKAVYGIAVIGLMFSAQGASAGEQYWTGEKYEGVSAATFPTFPSEAEAPRSVVAPKGQSAGRDQKRTQSGERPFPPNHPG